EQAKQALKQLGFKATAAKRALEEACAHVGTDADIPTLVRQVLAMNRAVNLEDSDPETLAKRALVKSGYPTAIAAAAVSAARAHVSTDAGLELLIMEAFRRCGNRG
ncbi:MAG TPA: RuvA C-terminal domain-containing protein, partial [Kofleriaceae bacterium]